MSMQQRSDERSMALHREIAKRLRTDPTLWEIPKRNLAKWKQRRGRLTLAAREWERILNTNTKDGFARCSQFRSPNAKPR